jgi:hypothetical protein
MMRLKKKAIATFLGDAIEHTSLRLGLITTTFSELDKHQKLHLD